MGESVARIQGDITTEPTKDLDDETHEEIADLANESEPTALEELARLQGAVTTEPTKDLDTEIRVKDVVSRTNKTEPAAREKRARIRGDVPPGPTKKLHAEAHEKDFTGLADEPQRTAHEESAPTRSESAAEPTKYFGAKPHEKDVLPGTPEPDAREKSEDAVQLMYGAELLTECARGLKYSAVVSALAGTIYHRFFASVSPRLVSPVWGAAAALLLAGKHEGVYRRLRDVANVVHSRVVGREGWDARGALDYYGAAGYVWKQSIATTELKVLHELGFRLEFETPHKFVLVFVNTLREKAAAGDWLDPPPPGEAPWRALLQHAWAAANDLMRLPACVAHRAEDLACACIARAAREEVVPLPQQWAHVFGAAEPAIAAVERALVLLYAAPPLRGEFRDLAQADIAGACRPGGRGTA